jgi:hypothetical protein
MRRSWLFILLCVLAITIGYYINHFQKANSFRIPPEHQLSIASEMYRVGTEHNFRTLADDPKNGDTLVLLYDQDKAFPWSLKTIEGKRCGCVVIQRDEVALHLANLLKTTIILRKMEGDRWSLMYENFDLGDPEVVLNTFSTKELEQGQK